MRRPVEGAGNADDRALRGGEPADGHVEVERLAETADELAGVGALLLAADGGERCSALVLGDPEVLQARELLRKPQVLVDAVQVGPLTVDPGALDRAAVGGGGESGRGAGR